MSEPRPIASILRDPSEWPLAACPTCDTSPRPHPHGAFGPQQCDDCRDREAEIAREAWRRREYEDRRANLSALLSRANCPTRYKHFTRDAWEAAYGPWQGAVTGRLVGWTGEEPESWLVLLYGRYGRRKTSLATALLGERIVAGKHGLWWDAAEWTHKLQVGIKDDTSAEVYRSAAAVDVLLLDDLGSVIGAREGRRAEQTWWAEQLTLLLRHREAWCKPTIVTANIEAVDELGKIDRSLPSRCDVPLAFKLGGPDYRAVAPPLPTATPATSEENP